jgi:hypothetical protein
LVVEEGELQMTAQMPQLVQVLQHFQLQLLAEEQELQEQQRPQQEQMAVEVLQTVLDQVLKELHHQLLVIQVMEDLEAETAAAEVQIILVEEEQVMLVLVELQVIMQEVEAVELDDKLI